MYLIEYYRENNVKSEVHVYGRSDAERAFLALCRLKGIHLMVMTGPL